MADIYNYITLYSALGILSVMTALLLSMIAYSVYLKKQYDMHVADHRAYSDKLDEMFAEGKRVVPEEFFPEEVSHKHRLSVVERYIQKHCLAERHPHIEKVRQFALDIGVTAHLREQARRRDPAISAFAVRLLVEVGQDSDKDLFRQILEEGSHRDLMLASSIGLARFNALESIEQIVEKLYDAEHPNRDMILSVLSIFDDEAIEPVTELLKKTELGTALITTLIDFLGVKKAVVAKPVLEEMLKDSSDSELNIHIVEALEKVGDEHSCPLILPCLKDSDFRVRLKAVNALERLSKDKYIHQAEKMLEDRHLFVRRNAAEAISRMGAAGRQKLKDLALSENKDIAIISKLILEEHRFGKIRWRFRYGDSIV